MRGLLDLLLPPACCGCGASESLLCSRCRSELVRPFDPGDRFVAPDAGVVVGDALTMAIAAFRYAGPMRRALAALKYAGASRLAALLADAALPVLAELLEVSGPAALVPVPVHRTRLRERGYNQAELLTRALSARSAVASSLVLERVRPTAKQHRLDRTSRLANMRGAFRTVGGQVPSKVVLVDDIITTAATLEYCASVLRHAGAQEVYGFALAREV